jgi:hypothetical protein
LAEICALFGQFGSLSLVQMSFGDFSWYIVELRWCAPLETSSLAYEWIWLGELGFDLASCGIGKEISAFVGFSCLFHSATIG